MIIYNKQRKKCLKICDRKEGDRAAPSSGGGAPFPWGCRTGLKVEMVVGIRGKYWNFLIHPQFVFLGVVVKVFHLLGRDIQY